MFFIGLLGAVLLLVAEFTTLFVIHSSAYGAATQTEGTGAHNSYALVPLALLAGVLTVVAVRSRSRVALLGIAAVGLVALGIALLGDLPDAQASGFIGSGANLASASSTPSTGLYLETLGAVVLLMASAAGFLLLNSTIRRATHSERSQTPI